MINLAARADMAHLPLSLSLSPVPGAVLQTPTGQQHVGIPKKSTGDKVNLEVDVLGKYVERSLSSVLDRLGALEDWKQVRVVDLLYVS